MTSVSARLRSGTRTTLVSGRHQWMADEPETLGGSDQGPTPYELLLGSLASCIAITLRLYAEHKGIPLQGVDVTLELDRLHSKDCELCDDPDEGMIERIQTKVDIWGETDEAQKKRLTQIAGRCPVHKTLAHGVKIFDEVTFPG